MSNWFTYHHINRQNQSFNKRKKKIIQVLVSLLIIFFGSWIVLAVLESSGIHPLSSSQKTAHLSPLSGFFSPSVEYWHEEIFTWAEVYDLDPLLIATVMQIESCGDPHAVSPAGAQGLFQVMPYHFQSDEDMLDPQTNALRGLTYLRQSLSKSNGDVQLTLAGYNGGHGQIGRNPNQWPTETKRYVDWGSVIYQDALRNDDTGEALEEWLSAGGRYLCQQAANRLDLP
jgi:soluble lytic murein transglycosylase-like protein